MKKLALFTTFLIAGTANAGFFDSLGKVLDTTGKVLDTVSPVVGASSSQNNSNQSIFGSNRRLVDVTKFDVSGIKLGMTPNEVMQVIKNKFPNGKISSMNQSNPFDSKIKYNLIDTISVDSEKQRLVVYFGVVSLNGEKNKQLVHLVTYQIPDETQNVKSIKEASINKYGNPTNGSVAGENYVNWRWCDHTVQAGELCDLQQPSLTLYSTKLTLTDPRYEIKRREVISQMQTTKPNI